MRPFHLISTLFLMTASAAPAATFSNLPFDQARTQAARDHKILLIDFYTTWCGPCKQLDQTTWPDPAVSKLLSEKTIPLRLDAEKEAALAARYNIEALPTILLLNPDGTEIDRLTGYRDPKTFLADFTTSTTGPDTLTRARTAVANAPNDPESHIRLARLLAARKQYPDALAEYLWCFDHGRTAQPPFDTAPLPSAIARVARSYPPARAALETRRDARLARALPTSTDTDTDNFRELLALNSALRQPERNLPLLDALPPAAPARPILTKLLIPELIEAQRYQDILTSIDPVPTFTAQIAQLKQQLAATDPARRATLEPFLPELITDIGLDYFEALAATHRDADARAIATLILTHSDTPDTRQSLTDRAARANNYSVAPK